MTPKEDSLAFCYLTEPPDERQMVLVTKDEIIVRSRQNAKVFNLDSIQAMDTGHKVILFPAIIGGITCPLFLVAAFNNVGELWLMMSLAFGGLLAVYYGLSGTESFILKTKVKDFDFFIATPNRLLPVFCHFYNHVLVKGRLDTYFCVEIDDKTWELNREKGIIPVPGEGIPLTGIDHLSAPTTGSKWYAILSPVNNGYKIGFRQRDLQHVQAMLFSDLKMSDLRLLKGIDT